MPYNPSTPPKRGYRKEGGPFYPDPNAGIFSSYIEPFIVPGVVTAGFLAVVIFLAQHGSKILETISRQPQP